MSPESPRTSIDQIATPDEFTELDVPVHVDTDTVEQEIVDTVSEMDDLAPTGIRRSDGSVLLMRVEDDCAWKIPSKAVGTDEPYGVAVKEWISEIAGLEIELEGVEGIWRIELTAEETGETATRHFVVFSASPNGSSQQSSLSVMDVPADKQPADIGWFDELPDEAEEPPGTDLFFE